ncbi:MAG: lysophospholipase [Acidibacillus sp.]|nr:lysophospholipase [Acidibacillus sp.]
MSESPYHLSFHEATEPTCIVTIIHGAGEHSGRYDYVREAFAQQQITTVMGDLPGHGYSRGQRGHIESFDEYVEAALYFLEVARERYGTALPHVIIGHSMGGLIAALAVAKATNQPDLLVLSSPAFGLRMKISPTRAWLARVLLPIAPRLMQPNGIAPQDVTRNQELAVAYGSDPLVSHTVSLRWYFEFTEAMNQILLICHSIQIPISVWQGGADRLVDPASVRHFVETCNHHTITYKEFPGLYHEIFNEPERDEVIADIISWIKINLTKD